MRVPKKTPLSAPLAASLVLAALSLALPADLRSQTCPDAGIVRPQMTLQEAIRALGVNMVNVCAAVPVSTKHARVVIVDSAEGGDFTTLSAAFAYVTSQSPSTVAPWSVIIMPGQPNGSGNSGYNYLETNLTVPPQTSVQGLYGGASGASPPFGTLPIVRLNCVSGTCLTVSGGASLSGFLIRWSETPTAAVKVIEISQGASTQTVTLFNLGISVTATSNAFAVDALTNTSGSTYVYQTYISESSNASGRVLVNADAVSGHGITVYGGRFRGSSGCATLIENTGSSGIINLFYSRLDAGCAADLKQTAGTIAAYSTTYGPVSGTVTNAATYDAYGTSNPATCSPGQRFLNTTTPASCACVATNTWKCVTLL